MPSINDTPAVTGWCPWARRRAGGGARHGKGQRRVAAAPPCPHWSTAKLTRAGHDQIRVCHSERQQGYSRNIGLSRYRVTWMQYDRRQHRAETCHDYRVCARKMCGGVGSAAALLAGRVCRGLHDGRHGQAGQHHAAGARGGHGGHRDRSAGWTAMATPAGCRTAVPWPWRLRLGVQLAGVCTLDGVRRGVRRALDGRVSRWRPYGFRHVARGCMISGIVASAGGRHVSARRARTARTRGGWGRRGLRGGRSRSACLAGVLAALAVWFSGPPWSQRGGWRQAHVGKRHQEARHVG